MTHLALLDREKAFDRMNRGFKWKVFAVLWITENVFFFRLESFFEQVSFVCSEKLHAVRIWSFYKGVQYLQGRNSKKSLRNDAWERNQDD